MEKLNDLDKLASGPARAQKLNDRALAILKAYGPDHCPPEEQDIFARILSKNPELQAIARQEASLDALYSDHTPEWIENAAPPAYLLSRQSHQVKSARPVSRQTTDRATDSTTSWLQSIFSPFLSNPGFAAAGLMMALFMGGLSGLVVDPLPSLTASSLTPPATSEADFSPLTEAALSDELLPNELLADELLSDESLADFILTLVDEAA